MKTGLLSQWSALPQRWFASCNWILLPSFYNTMTSPALAHTSSSMSWLDLWVSVCLFQQRCVDINNNIWVENIPKEHTSRAADRILAAMNYETMAQNWYSITVKFIISARLNTEIHIIYSKLSSESAHKQPALRLSPFCCSSPMWWVHQFPTVIYDAPTISPNHIHRSTFF